MTKKNQKSSGNIVKIKKPESGQDDFSAEMIVKIEWYCDFEFYC